MQPENYRLVDAKYLGDYNIMVQFQDGTKEKINLANELNIGKLAELKDTQMFAKFEIHPIFKTLCWANGADFAPEFLLSMAKAPH